MTLRIRAEGLGIRFQFDRNQRVVTPNLARLRRRGTEAWGLRDVTFDAEPGEAIGAARPERSRASRRCCGCSQACSSPTRAAWTVSGEIASLPVRRRRAHGAADRPRERVAPRRPRGPYAGRGNGRAWRTCDGAAASSDAFERPVSSYSQGMRARLGFAAADLPWTDVLLLDEVHEALDHEYREVVEARAQEIVAAGGVVVAAGHDHPLLDRICTRALWIDGGRIVADGPFAELQERYLARRHGTERCRADDRSECAWGWP